MKFNPKEHRMKSTYYILVMALAIVPLKSYSDTLSGDTKLSCEALLCLSSSTRPSECNPALQRYFSIHAKKFSKTIQLRRQFLQLCPTGGASSNDKNFIDLRDNVLPTLDGDCSAASLNQKIETNFDDGFQMVRINPKLSSSCQALINHSYTNLKPHYTCSAEFYTSMEWKQGYKVVRGQKITINKNCWVD